MTNEYKVPVTVEGGWSNGGVMQLTVSDPHNSNRMIELEIPLETFTNMLRNYHGFEPPLATMRLFRKSISGYGHEHQSATIIADATGLTAKTWDSWVKENCPAGWTPAFGYSSHRQQTQARTYKLGISRHVPVGTDPVVEGHPDVKVDTRYKDIATWGD